MEQRATPGHVLPLDGLRGVAAAVVVLVHSLGAVDGGFQFMERALATPFGALVNASHASMRDDFEISTRDVDTLVTIGQQHPDILGARMTGGGFGGSVVMIARAGAGRAAAHQVQAEYVARTGRPGRVLLP